MSEWEKASAELNAIDAAIRRKWAERLARAYADTTGWDLRRLHEQRKNVEARVREMNVVPLVPRQKPAAVG
jgi:hypothetical protein